MSAALFGMQHYYGVPYGVVGVIMAGIWAGCWEKAVGNKGIAWAWGIHFCQDVLIFTFMAVGSIVAGGIK